MRFPWANDDRNPAPLPTPDPPGEPERTAYDRDKYLAMRNGMKMCPICGGDTMELGKCYVYNQYGNDTVFDFGCFECKRVISVQLNGTLGPKGGDT